jgi:Uma2 family endonuclease
MSTATVTRYTPEDLLAMPDGKSYELVRGELVERHGEDRIPKGWVKIPPDLAVEVISPNDKAEVLEEKLDDYRRVHVPLVWVIYPDLRKVKVYRNEGPTTDLREDDELSGEDAIPGFRCRVGEILPPLPASANGTAPAAGPNGV